MTIKQDLHIHSTFSDDGKDDISTMCRAAIKKGFTHICFTEHVVYDKRDFGYDFFRCDDFFKQIKKNQDKFGDKITILTGIEFSEPYLFPKEFEFYSKKEFDCILGAIHWLPENFISAPEILDVFSTEEVFEKYYTQVIKALEFGGFDALAHCDLPKRYLNKSYNDPKIVNQFISELVSKNIALEINTSPLRKGCKESSPDKEILDYYIKANGKNIIVGSDAHNHLDIGKDFDYAEKLLNNKAINIGFFQNRKFILANN